MPYRPPGVTVTLNSQAGISDNTGVGDTLMVVGTADNFPQTVTENIILTGVDGSVLSKKGIDALTIDVDLGATELVLATDYQISQSTDALGVTTTSINKKSAHITAESHTLTGAGTSVSLVHGNLVANSAVVKNAADSVTYVLGTDYLINEVNGTVTQVATGSIANNGVIHVTYDWTTFADGSVVNVTYSNTPEDLYLVKNWSNLADAIAFYGPAMSGDSINSRLSLFCTLASQALVGSALPTIKTLAIDPDADPASNLTQVDPTDWTASLNSNLSGEEFTHLLVLDGTIGIIGIANTFLNNRANTNSKFSRGFVGVDSTTVLLNYATGVSSLFGLASDRMELASCESIPWVNPTTGNLVLLPGYFAAAIVGTQESVLPLNRNMTHQKLNAFSQFLSTQTISENDKNKLAASGVTVIENFGTGLRVRHAKTTALNGPASEEPSITRSFDFMRRDLQTTFDASVIGQDFFVSEETKIVLNTQATARFNEYLRRGIIAGFTGVSVTTGADPRSITISASVSPLFPLNNIDFAVTVLSS